MSILGIIAEYNPFHNGHLYHIQKAKEISGIDCVICVMSGNFVQRGEPAIFDKWSRAEMALSQGIDIVLELPVMYATRSAYWFARGAIETLHKTGIVTHLTFGVETTNTEVLLGAAELLAKESQEFKSDIKSALNEGLSFPRARAKALSKYFSPDIFSTPNNVLGLAYLQVLRERNIPLIPVPVVRKGTSYNEGTLTPNALPSATAIRHRLLEKPEEMPSTLEAYLPLDVLSIISNEIKHGRGPVLADFLDSQVMTLLRKSSIQELQSIVDISEGLENRIMQKAQMSVNTKDFLDSLKTKRFTYSRLQRFLIHLLLDYNKDKAAYLTGGPHYLRLLGFTSQGRKMLKKIKSEATIPLITKPAHAIKLAQGNDAFNVFWDMDTLATNLYSLLYPNMKVRSGNLDYYRQPISLLRQH
jgi:predicted nucleotidyltransferase